MRTSDPAIDAATFRIVTEALSDPVVLLTLDGSIVDANRRFARMLNPDAAETLAALADDAPETVTAVVRRWASSTGPQPGAVTVRGTRFTGYGARLAGTSTMLVRLVRRDMAVQPFAELSREVDVADLRRTKQRLRRALRELEETNAELLASRNDLSQFASVVAHDLRSPLVTMAGTAHLLADASDVGEDSQAVVQILRDSVERMQRQIAAILEAARSGRPLPSPPVHVGDLLNGLLDDLSAELTEAEADVEVDTPVLVPVGEAELTQLFQNLLENAVKYRRGDRPLEVRVAASAMDGARLLLSVTDNGRGIAPDDRLRVFKPLQRADAADVPGSGIGLSTCQRIVTRHGGRIEAIDGLDGGVTIRFDLPGVPDD